MIQFFRRIRKELLAQNRVGKYLLYALGEIILVVIGILIALQINNWNQSSQNAEKEQNILKALRKEFVQNQKRYEQTVNWQNGAIQSCLSFIECLDKKDVIFKIDSISHFISHGAWNYYRAEPVIGTYEALNGSGDIYLISNDSLKSMLAFFASEIYQGFEDETNSMDIINQLIEELSPYYVILMSADHKRRNGLKNVSDPDLEESQKLVKEMYENPRIISLMMRHRLMEGNRLGLQKKMLALSQGILELIDSELEE